MKNVKIYEKNLKKKVGALALSFVLGVTTLGLTGCSNDTKDDVKKNVTYTVEDVLDNKTTVIDYPFVFEKFARRKEDVVCETYVDLNQVSDCSFLSVKTGEMAKMSDDELAQTNYKLDYVYPVRELKLSSGDILKSFENGYLVMTTATFRKEPTIIIPDCYKWAEDYFGSSFNKNLSTINYTVQELKGVNGNYYVNYEFNIEFDNDIELSSPTLHDYEKEISQIYGPQKSIKKGDSLSYKALYIMNRDEANNKNYVLLADEQKGMGSDCENVKTEVKHNYNKVYKDIESLSRNNESIVFTSLDIFENFIFDDNNRKNKVRVK